MRYKTLFRVLLKFLGVWLVVQGVAALSTTAVQFMDVLDAGAFNLTFLSWGLGGLVRLIAGLYLFFDEIQEVEGWEKFVRRMYDTVSKKIFITGSSAKMLGKEIATSLRGRNIVYNLLPLSFDEYCKFQNIDTTDVYSTRGKAILKSQFDKYMKLGGFPETIFMDEEVTRRTLQSYFDVMLFRDIVERYKIQNVVVLKQFLKKILNNISSNLSVNKFYNELKSQGFTLSKNTIYEYLDYSLDCFLLFLLNPYEPSIVKQQMKIKKVYAIDTGLVNAITYRFSEDKGKLLENIIFLQIIREENPVFYLKNKYECDFVIQKKDTITHAVQVSFTLSDATTRSRELRGLTHAMQRFNLAKGYIITLDEEDEFVFEGKKIIVQPIWRWLLTDFTWLTRFPTQLKLE